LILYIYMNKEKDIEITLEKAKLALDMWNETDYVIMMERGNNTYFPKILKFPFDPKNVSSPPPFIANNNLVNNLVNNLATKIPLKNFGPRKRVIGMNIFGR